VVDLARPELIFHLAAQSSVTVSVTDPGRDCAVNVGGTLNVLEAAVRHRAPVIFSSTGGALYGNEAPLPTTEDRIPAPLAPYGASKWAGEAYLLTWSRAHDLPARQRVRPAPEPPWRGRSGVDPQPEALAW